ncbi:MAG: hypothetical protein AB8B71_12685 [Paracoccaceae bacterium]
MTKFATADRRHRVVLHHCDLGADITAMAFSSRSDVKSIVRQHVCEDLGREATLDEWFQLCDMDRMPRPVERRIKNGAKGVADHVTGRTSEALRPAIGDVCSFLFQPIRYLSFDSHHALPLLMNSAGPMIVRYIFGPPTEIPDGTMVDYAWIAEAAIFTSFGRIPDLSEIVTCWSDEPTKALMEAV